MLYIFAPEYLKNNINITREPAHNIGMCKDF